MAAFAEGKLRLIVGLGGNRGDVLGALARACGELAAAGELLARSSLWRSAAIGPPQPDFLNAALLLATGLHPTALLELCQRIERDAGRDRAREPRWGPRPLDLDLLIAPRLVIESPRLTLPHPRLAERRFALAPAAELAPEWHHPRGCRTLGELAAAPSILAQRCERVGPFPPG
ncbi:MAG TPA: 2-amino-4-hydroxy-6-hydroxymethyldihydropteridine diphosphokinase [Thermoanaerobaculaceae bacterium]|nr:2-amino-4-hydroxy-6-hydroxymethyldihydropteridine diphosphokinase [Thermoanaerobaculaceae bacterium]